ncbi:hypothetical protein ACOSP7_024816 [Xanthoceras sorbifolium]
MDRFAFIVFVQPLEFVCQFAITAWFIWRLRNQLVHGKPDVLKEDIWLKVGQYQADFVSACAGRSGSPSVPAAKPTGWKPTSGNIY